MATTQRCWCCGNLSLGQIEFNINDQRWECKYQNCRCHETVHGCAQCDLPSVPGYTKCTTHMSMEDMRKIKEEKASNAVVIDGKGVKGSMFKLKLPVELVPPLFIRMVALVLLFGARKYKKNNWMKGMQWSEIIAGTIRHIYAFMEGKEYDEESGLPHLAHAACGLMFLIWFAYGPNKNKYVEFDDRAYQWNDSEGKAINDPWEKEVERINNINFEKIAVKEAK